MVRERRKLVDLKYRRNTHQRSQPFSKEQKSNNEDQKGAEGSHKGRWLTEEKEKWSHALREQKTRDCRSA